MNSLPKRTQEVRFHEENSLFITNSSFYLTRKYILNNVLILSSFLVKNMLY